MYIGEYYQAGGRIIPPWRYLSCTSGTTHNYAALKKQVIYWRLIRMLKKKLAKVLIIVLLFLLVPYLIGRITGPILGIINRPPALPKTRMTMQEEAAQAIASLGRARAVTRITLGVIGGYYVVIISGW